MSKKYNIDDLLSESFENFSPEAPDVWQGIQQGIQAAQASGAAGSAMVAAKGSAMVVKIIAAVAVVSAIAVGYVLYTPTDRAISNTAQQEQPAVSAQAIPQAVESKPTEPSTASAVSTQSEQPAAQQPSSKARKVATEKNIVPPTPIIESSNAQVVETKKEDVLPKQMNTEVVVSENKPISTQPKPTVTETTQAQPITEAKSAPATNPNTEETVFEEPIIPGSFSPNGDGHNDVFKIVIENEQFFLLTIYDKQGKTVFVSDNKENTWDGKDYRNGNPCLPGTYNWVFRYQYKGAENESSPKRGILKLIF